MLQGKQELQGHVVYGRYALVSPQGKGQPKYVRMRGETVEEVVTKTEYTSAVRQETLCSTVTDPKETGAVLHDDEIGHAFQFGHEGTIQNVLETNWWESRALQEEQRQVAEELLEREKERIRHLDEGEEVESKEPKVALEVTDRVTARTRVSSIGSEVDQSP